MEFFFIHSLSKYLLSVYSIPDAILGSGNTSIKTPETCPVGVYNCSQQSTYLLDIPEQCLLQRRCLLTCLLIDQTKPSFSSVQFSRSVVSDSLQPHESQHASLPVHHKLPEFTQTHAHRVGDAIQPSHPLSSLSPPAPIPSQHQGLFPCVNSSHEVAKILEFELQHQSFQ